MPLEQLAKAFTDVVKVEAPVHLNEVVRRIRTHLGIDRTDNKTCEVISWAGEFAELMQSLVRRGDFFWSPDRQDVSARRRTGDPPAKLELICDEEIAEAVKLVLKHQFATQEHDLIVKSSRILGIRVTGEAAAARIRAVIEKLIGMGELRRLSSGMIDLSSLKQ